MKTFKWFWSSVLVWMALSLCLGQTVFAAGPSLNYYGKKIKLRPASEDAYHYIGEIQRKLHIKGSIYPMYGRVGYASATFSDGNRVLVINPKAWARKGTGLSAFVFILGHELGHHKCRHLLSGKAGHHQELVADRIGGAAVKAMGLSLKGVLHDVSRLFSKIDSRSHPRYARRIKAIKKGYRHGASCR